MVPMAAGIGGAGLVIVIIVVVVACKRRKRAPASGLALGSESLAGSAPYAISPSNLEMHGQVGVTPFGSVFEAKLQVWRECG